MVCICERVRVCAREREHERVHERVQQGLQQCLLMPLKVVIKKSIECEDLMMT